MWDDSNTNTRDIDGESTHREIFMKRIYNRLTVPQSGLLSKERYDKLVEQVKLLKAEGKCNMNVTWLKSHYDVISVSNSLKCVA